MSAFFRYLRQHVVFNLRNLCNLRIRIVMTLFSAEASAHTKQFAFLCASPSLDTPARHDAADVTQGQI